MSVTDLNIKYSYPKTIQFLEGENGFTKVRLSHDSGSILEVYLYGAHITSWIKPEFGDLLFLSRKAVFKEGKAVRGGIPIIFPQFGAGDLPQHGFARNSFWTCNGSEILKNNDISLTLNHKSNADTKLIWNYEFNAELKILLNEDLTTELTVQNLDKKPFTFQDAFHTYIKIGNISEVQVSGLSGKTFTDKLSGSHSAVETSEKLEFVTAFDRVYQDTPCRLELTDSSLKRQFIIEKENMADSVLWNPWENGNAMSDMHYNAYNDMICLESANIQPEIVLKAGDSHTSLQRLTVIRI